MMFPTLWLFLKPTLTHGSTFVDQVDVLPPALVQPMPCRSHIAGRDWGFSSKIGRFLADIH